jgi:hypothetical protein
MATLFSLTTTATTLLLTSAALAADAPGTMNAEQGWSSVARCAQEDTERARHTCLDRVLRDAGLLTDEMHARQQRKAFGLEDKPARARVPSRSAPATASAAQASSTGPSSNTGPSSSTAPSSNTGTSSGTALASGAVPASSAAASAPAPAVAAASAAQARPAASPAAPPADPDRLEVELTAVAKAANGRLFVTTKDGAVWLQTESVEMPQPPVAGDHMTIRKGSMGGYRCSVASTHLTYRCVRNR